MTARETTTRREGRARRRVPLAVPVGLMVVGLLVASAPLLMDLSYRASAHREVTTVEGKWSAADDGRAREVWAQARAFNRVLAGLEVTNGVESVRPYSRQLVYNAWPYICYLEVPSAAIELPVYHGTSDEALSSGAGHVEGTSLPVGGESSNCAISAHSGIASSRMFDGLREVQVGDYVEVHTLGRRLGYEVETVEIYDETDASALEISAERDLLTLVTCTSDPVPGMPRGGYGINDRRLVVTCARCALRDGEPVNWAAAAANERTIWPLVAAAAVCAALAAALVATRRSLMRRIGCVCGPWPEGSREARAMARACRKGR